MNLAEQGKYRCINEDGQFYLDYPGILDHPDLMTRIHEAQDNREAADNRCLILGRTLLVYGRKYLAQRADKARVFYELLKEQVANPLQFFSPSGPGALGFINDTHSKICFNVSPNRAGKTTTMCVKMILGIMPTDKTWPIFTEHGVKWRPYSPQKQGIASYEWRSIRNTVGPEVMKWLPVVAIPEYAHILRGGEGRTFNYEMKSLTLEEYGSEIQWYSYSQDQAPFESVALDGWNWDEQPEESKWDGANERLRSRRNSQHNFGLTPHRLPDNPFTGSGTFIHRLWKKDVCKGYAPDLINSYTIKLVSEQYNGEGWPLGDVPDWIFPEKNKKQAWSQHVKEATERGDIKALRSGRARLYGEWETSEGMVYNDWDRRIHRIDPFKIPVDAVRFRVLDHGRRNPTAVLWGAICKPGSTVNLGKRSITWPENESIMIVYREFYRADCIVSDACKKIVEASGNTMSRVDTLVNRWGSYEVFKENFESEKYQWTIGDPRSLSQPMLETGMKLQDVYRLNGLSLQPGPRQRVEPGLDIVRQWMAVDHKKPHPFWENEMGFTKLLVFSTCVNFMFEIEGYINVEMATKARGIKNLVEKPRDKDDHLMDCVRMLLAQKPVWRNTLPPARAKIDNERKQSMRTVSRHVDPITKY